MELLLGLGLVWGYLGDALSPRDELHSGQGLSVVCHHSDCMREGWDVERSPDSPALLQVSCLQSDCERKGWVEYVVGGPVPQASCLREDCFKHGWQARVYGAKEYVEVKCRRGREGSDCLLYGWDFHVNHQLGGRARCLRGGNGRRGDCRNFGWVVTVEGQPDVYAYCTKNDCFVHGWTLSLSATQP